MSPPKLRRRATLCLVSFTRDHYPKKQWTDLQPIAVDELDLTFDPFTIDERTTGSVQVAHKSPVIADFQSAVPFGDGRVGGLEGPVARRADQPQWRDPASGYLRRNVSPPGVPQPMQIVEVHFPPGRRVAFETGAREARVFQQVWVLKGTIDITVGDKCHRLHEGDCLAMQLDVPTMFHNPTRQTTRYAVVIACEPPARKR